jgi:hypothetical protein
VPSGGSSVRFTAISIHFSFRVSQLSRSEIPAVNIQKSAIDTESDSSGFDFNIINSSEESL